MTHRTPSEEEAELNSKPAETETSVARWLVDRALLGIVEIDGEQRVTKALGGLVDWVEVGRPAVGSIPFLVGYEDLLAEVGSGALDQFRLPRIRYAGPGSNEGRIYSLRATPAPARGRVTLLFQDASELGTLEQRVVQQRNELTLAQAALEEARERAEAASRAKSAFLANISHELRTPLTVIMGNAEILRDRGLEGLPPASRAAFIDDIHSNGQYLLELINDLLDLSKAEAGKILLELDRVELAPLFDEALEIARSLPYCRGLTLRRELPEALPALWCDRLRVKQVLVNLLGNAVKFTPDGGSIALSARPGEAGGLAIEVADDGVGMDRDELARVLEPFVQGHAAARSGAPGGTGLGLHLVHLLMELHGGSVAIDSSPGAGTRVRLDFPPSAPGVDATGGTGKA